MAENQNLDFGKALVEHYYDSFSYAARYWQQRNYLFILLLLTMAVASILTLKIGQGNSLLVELLANLLNLPLEHRAELASALPVNILHSIFLTMVFFLLGNIVHQNTGVQRLYRYVGKLEDEIRAGFSLDDKALAFTREGTFYYERKTIAHLMIPWFYKLIFLVLLSSFVLSRLAEDWMNGQWLFFTINAFIALGIGLFYLMYAGFPFPATDEK